MRLSAPIYRLKRKARRFSQERNIPLHQALDHIAEQEGFRGWSLLAAKMAALAPAEKLFARLAPGDMLLLGARPGEGKTAMSFELAAEAVKAGHRAIIFSLDYTEQQVRARVSEAHDVGHDLERSFEIDCSDAICAEHIVRRLATAASGTLVVIDYLQLLDQRRTDPDLEAQVRTLKAFARDKGLVLIFIAQIDRAYVSSNRAFPGLDDVRLPNPLDLRLFGKTCFLHDGEVRFGVTG